MAVLPSNDHCDLCGAPATYYAGHPFATVRFDLRAALQERIAGLTMEDWERYWNATSANPGAIPAAIVDLLMGDQK